MKRFAWFLCALSLNAGAGEAERVFERVRASVFTVEVMDETGQVDGEGSAVAIAPGRLVTNCHVVAEAVSIRVNAANAKLEAKPLHADVERDLCSLSVQGLNAPGVAQRAARELQPGERVYAVGNPLGFGLSVSAGLVSLVGKDEPVIVTSAAISPGSSGGGLFDAEGRLVGITTAVRYYAQNANIAQPSDWIADLPKRAKPLASMGKQAAEREPDWFGEASALRQTGKWNELLRFAQRWRKSYPTSGDAQTYAAIALLGLERAQEARDLLSSIVREHPLHAEARTILGAARMKLGDTTAAQADFEAAIGLQPGVLGNDARASLEDLHQSAGRLEAAERVTKDALRLQPSAVQHWLDLGYIRATQKRQAEALHAYATALKLDPNSAIARSGVAMLQAQLGEAGAARQTLGASGDGAGLAAHNAQTWIGIGYADEQKARYGEAEKAYRKALALAPDSAAAWYRLGVALLLTNRGSEAEPAFRNVIKYDPKSGAAWLGVGEIQKARGETNEAMQSFKKAVALEPKLAAAWRSLGYLQRETRDFAAVAHSLGQTVAIEATHADDWAYLGEALIKLRRMDEALAALQRAERLDANNLIALQSLAIYHGARGEQAKALEYAERGVQLDAADAGSWSNKGYGLLKLKRYDEAVQALQTAVRLAPDHVPAWINLGEALIRKKEIGKAIGVLEKACRLAPEAIDARTYLAQAYAMTGQGKKAKEHLEVLTQRQPKYAQGWLMLAAVQLELGEQKAMGDSYAQLKALQPALAQKFKEKVAASKYRDMLPE